MGDIRQRVDGTALEFAQNVTDESMVEARGAMAELPDDPEADFTPLEDDINDVEAALNPDGQFVEPLPALDQSEQALNDEEGRAGD